MAEAFLTLSQLVTINDRNLADVDVPNFLNNSPFMRTNAATIASQNTLHKYLRYTNPSTGFRAENDGREVQVSTDTMVTVTCKIMDATFRTDLALADEYREGRDAWVNREGARSLDSAFFSLEQQVFQGTALDALGFDGFPDDPSLDGLTDPNVINAGGTTNLSSVYLVRSGMEDVEIITGDSGNISIEPATVQETTGTTGTFPSLYVPITAWYALKIGSTVSSVVRIANIDTAAAAGDATAMTDDKFYAAYSKFGSGRGPTHVYCHRTTLEQWRGERTTYNPIGTPAPLMENIQGVQIIPTDGISIDETAVA